MNEQESYLLEHLIDALVCDHWQHPATAGLQPGCGNVPKDRSYLVEVGEHRLKVYQRDLLRGFDGQVALFRAWLDGLPPRDVDDGPA